MYQFYDYLKKNDINHRYSLVYSGSLRFLELIKVIRTIKKSTMNVDIAHVQYGSLIGLLVVIFSKAKHNVISLRGSDFYRLPIKDSMVSAYFHSLLAFIFTRITLLLCRNFIFMSKRMVEDYTFSKNLNFLVLPDPLGSYFLKYKGIRLKSRRKIWKPITIGFIAQEKNSCVKNIHLANEIINKVSLEQDIHFLRIGNLNPRDVPEIFTGLDLLLLTSHYEGFPNVVKEALFMGVPFASTDVSDLRLASTFIPGSFVCSGSSSEFADKILSNIRLGLYSKPTDFDETAYVNYISQFYPSHSAKKLISFYYKILKND